MRIEVRGRNTEVTPELEDAIRKRFKRVAKQVSELATLDVELSEEKNPRIADEVRRRGDTPSQGHDHPRQGGESRDARLDP